MNTPTASHNGAPTGRLGRYAALAALAQALSGAGVGLDAALTGNDRWFWRCLLVPAGLLTVTSLLLAVRILRRGERAGVLVALQLLWVGFVGVYAWSGSQSIATVLMIPVVVAAALIPVLWSGAWVGALGARIRKRGQMD